MISTTPAEFFIDPHELKGHDEQLIAVVALLSPCVYYVPPCIVLDVFCYLVGLDPFIPPSGYILPLLIRCACVFFDELFSDDIVTRSFLIRFRAKVRIMFIFLAPEAHDTWYSSSVRFWYNVTYLCVLMGSDDVFAPSFSTSTTSAVASTSASVMTTSTSGVYVTFVLFGNGIVAFN